MREIEAYSYGCLMARLPEPVATRIIDYGFLIPDDRIYDEDGDKGREDKPHITIKYGLHTGDPQEVLSKLEGQPSLRGTLGSTSVFMNGDFVVLKIGIRGSSIFRLNKYVSSVFECTDTFPDYHPHVTISYVVPDEKDPYWFNEYMTDMFEGIEVEIDELVFSVPTGKKYRIPLTGGAPMIDDSEMMTAAIELLDIAKEVL